MCVDAVCVLVSVEIMKKKETTTKITEKKNTEKSSKHHFWPQSIETVMEMSRGTHQHVRSIHNYVWHPFSI